MSIKIWRWPTRRWVVEVSKAIRQLVGVVHGHAIKKVHAIVNGLTLMLQRPHTVVCVVAELISHADA